MTSCKTSLFLEKFWLYVPDAANNSTDLSTNSTSAAGVTANCLNH